MLIETTSNSSPTVHCTSFSDFTVASSTRLQSIGHVWYAKTNSVGRLPSKKSPSFTVLPSVSRKVASRGQRAPEVLDDVDALELGGRRVGHPGVLGSFHACARASPASRGTRHDARAAARRRGEGGDAGITAVCGRSDCQRRRRRTARRRAPHAEAALAEGAGAGPAAARGAVIVGGTSRGHLGSSPASGADVLATPTA